MLPGIRTIENSSEDQLDDSRTQVLPHLDALYRHAGTLRLSEQAVQDLIEETYLAVYGDLDGDHGGTELKIRLFSTLRDLYTEHHEHIGESVDTTAETEPRSYEGTLDEVPLGTEKGIRETFFSDISSEDVTRALSTLPERYLTCVDLADVENFSYDEISEILNRPRKTVKSQLHRGRDLIKQKLVERAISRGILPSGSR